MATSRSASAAARLSRSAMSAFRAGSIRSDRPRALISSSGTHISSSTPSSLNRLACRPYTSSSSGQIPGARGIRAVFYHINEGMEEVLADYVHHEMTRTWISICLRLFVIIMTKDVVVAVADL